MWERSTTAPPYAGIVNSKVNLGERWRGQDFRTLEQSGLQAGWSHRVTVLEDPRTARQALTFLRVHPPSRLLIMALESPLTFVTCEKVGNRTRRTVGVASGPAAGPRATQGTLADGPASPCYTSEETLRAEPGTASLPGQVRLRACHQLFALEHEQPQVGVIGVLGVFLQQCDAAPTGAVRFAKSHDHPASLSRTGGVPLRGLGVDIATGHWITGGHVAFKNDHGVRFREEWWQRERRRIPCPR